ncbi:MAG: hypothetical protein HKN33_18445 [Pyrinomonadaceae bacterium]|nr:hypothetical protein [Pyrinomonadaceae bacterium]
MKKRIKPRFYVMIVLIPILYLGSYGYVRETRKEVWEKDKKTYVIFPEDKILYYVYRPLTIADRRLTGMQFHIGPHQ